MPTVEIKCPICNGTHPLKVTPEQSTGAAPVVVVCPAIDRRYRLFGFSVDTRRSVFHGKHDNLTQNQIAQLQAELGLRDFDQKLARWRSVDFPPLGLIEEYSDKIQEIVNTYSAGYFYPAVTAACCLAERILNRLVLHTRKHFPSHPEYKKIYQKQSFDDWAHMLDLIADWNLIPNKAVQLFRELMPVRHQTIHYKKDYDFAKIAAEVINKLIAAITEVFGVINRTDIFLVFNVPGEVWVRSSAEAQPFVKEFVLPHCYHAHAVHDIDFANNRIVERLGKIGPLSDEEFVALRIASVRG